MRSAGRSRNSEEWLLNQVMEAELRTPTGTTVRKVEAKLQCWENKGSMRRRCFKESWPLGCE